MVIDFFVDVMFIIDILINFRTTYINKKDEVGVQCAIESFCPAEVGLFAFNILISGVCACCVIV